MRQYLDLLKDVMDNGVDKEDRTGVGTRGVVGRQARFSMSEGFPLLTTKRVFWRGVVEELLWMISGSTNIRPLVQQGVSIWTDWPLKAYNAGIGNSKLSKGEFEKKIIEDSAFAARYGELGPVYGKQWRSWSRTVVEEDPTGRCAGFEREELLDQLAEAVRLIREDPTSRRILVSAWNAAEIPDMVASGLPPCHCLFQFVCRPIPLHDRLLRLKEILDAPHTYDSGLRRDTYNFTVTIDSTQLTIDDLILCSWPNANLSTPTNYEAQLARIVAHWMDNPVNVREDVHAAIRAIPKFYLDLILYQRSCDIFLGVPFNIASYALLLHMTASVTNTLPEEFIHTYGDLHIYQTHREAVQEQLQRGPRRLPTLTLKKKKELWDFTREDIELVGYNPYPPIHADVAV